MAEGILKKLLIEAGLMRVSVGSMGIHAQDGNMATGLAVQVCQENGIDISSHRSRPLIPEELKKSHLVLTMETVQVDFIDIFFPQVSDRLFMLGAWPERKIRKATVDDPVGKKIGVYRRTFLQLQKYVGNILPEFTERYGG
jgi:protein-tyrosine-phosphatase